MQPWLLIISFSLLFVKYVEFFIIMFLLDSPSAKSTAHSLPCYLTHTWELEEEINFCLSQEIKLEVEFGSPIRLFALVNLSLHANISVPVYMTTWAIMAIHNLQSFVFLSNSTYLSFFLIPVLISMQAATLLFTMTCEWYIL